MSNNKLIKIMLLVAIIVFIIISCSKKPAPKSIETDEVLISVSYADESFFKKYKTYDSFIEREEYAHRIAFIPNVPVKDFSWLEVGIDFDEVSDEFVFVINKVLYNLEELHPQKPLVVSWVEVGMMSAFGFSYLDKDGQKKYFMGQVGNYGDDPEEYDGPDFLISQFFPRKVESETELMSGKYFSVDYLCADNENILIGFKIENSSKILSVCIAKDESYIVYRFGTQDNIEFEFPENKTDSWDKFTASYGLQRITNMYFLEFINNEYRYVVYHHLWLDDYDHETVVGNNYGVGITYISTGEYTDLSGVSDSIIGGLNESIDHKKYKKLKIIDIGEIKADEME